MVKTHQSPSEATIGLSLSKRKREQEEVADSAKKTRSRVRYERFRSPSRGVALNLNFQLLVWRMSSSKAKGRVFISTVMQNAINPKVASVIGKCHARMFVLPTPIHGHRRLMLLCSV